MKSNIDSAKAIYQMIKGNLQCEETLLSVYCELSGNYPYCLKLTIKNSPIQFREIIIDGKRYSFDQTKC